MEIAMHLNNGKCVYSIDFLTWNGVDDYYQAGRIVTITRRSETVVYTRGDRGGHHLVLVSAEGDAYEYGNLRVLMTLKAQGETHAYRRAIKFLSEHKGKAHAYRRALKFMAQHVTGR